MRKPIDGEWPWLKFAKGSQPYWFHCASGEFEYAKPVIRELKQKNPNCTVLVTYFSPSVAKAVHSHPEVDLACPMPWDTSKNWQQFIEHHQPKALLIARTDLWPMMIHWVHKKKIPSLLFSKTVGKNRKGFASLFSHPMMRKLTDIFCVTEEDRSRLSH